MLGKLAIIGAVAAILMIPTALSAQMGGAINPGVHVNPGATVRGAVERGIPGPDLGTWRILRPLQSSADDGVDRHGQTSVLVGSRSGAKRCWIEGSPAEAALACFARRRCSGCGVDWRRSVSSVGQPTMMSALT
jgi:hypothetical protein